MSAPYLQFDAVSKSFGPLPVITPTSLDIARNEIVVFLGPSGCGKTTLMRMAGGLDVPSAGVIRRTGGRAGPKAGHGVPILFVVSLADGGGKCRFRYALSA
jgi:NitT/TauT family transport system ATP-binding protein